MVGRRARYPDFSTPAPASAPVPAPWKRTAHRLSGPCGWEFCRLHYVTRWVDGEVFRVPYPATFWWKPEGAPKSDWRESVVHHGPAAYYPSKMEWKRL